MGHFPRGPPSLVRTRAVPGSGVLVISHVLSTRAAEQDQARGAKEIDAQFAVVPDVFAQFANVVA